MAHKILIMGESGTGKTTSLRNCNPATTAIVNPVGKPLPFRGKFETQDGVTDSKKIVAFMKEQVRKGKKLLVVDDFQYILSIPYMNRIKESGWDKWNDFGANYFDIIDVCAELPDDVVVAYLSHCETLENGMTTIKLIGKLLREKITIEGLFTTVLRTHVSDGAYYFLTQNSGSDTVKSPLGMFPSMAIDNDLNYVDEKIRNYYYLDGAKSDEEMQAEDSKAKTDLEMGKGGRVKRTRRTEEEPTADKPQEAQEAPTEPQRMERKKRDQDTETPATESRTEAPTEEQPKPRTRRTRAKKEKTDQDSGETP